MCDMCTAYVLDKKFLLLERNIIKMIAIEIEMIIKIHFHFEK